jgi:cyclophilin family peptidyl-prolyl cis-trans isomerase
VPTEKRQRQREGRMARQEELRLAQQKSKRNRQIIIAVVVVALFAGVFYLVTRNSGGKSVATNATTTTSAVGATSSTAVTTPPVSVALISAPAGTGCPAADGSSPHYTKFSAAPPTCIDATKTYTATMQTDAGNIVIKLDATAAPKTVNNFVFLSGYHFFDGTAFHRVVVNFVDQGGDPTGTGSGGPGYSFADELPKAGAYKAGTLAMANSGANTNGSQFFIVASDAGGTQLQPNYSLFGQVTGGMDIVTKINNDGTTDSGGARKVVHKIVKVTIAAS